MSNSYKKAIFQQSGNYKRFAKRAANKRVRRVDDELSDGTFYKKIYNSWDISDFRIDDRFPRNSWRRWNFGDYQDYYAELQKDYHIFKKGKGRTAAFYIPK